MKPSSANSSKQGHAAEHRQEQPAPSWGKAKRQAVDAASSRVSASADARQAVGFMPLNLKGAAIRWRGL